tara:strand:- start:558 stop:821 length:264 start_codon:yes stop_codon:yes gene_type:complete
MYERETRLLQHAKERVELLQVPPRGEHGRVHVKFHGKLPHASEEVWHAEGAYSGRYGVLAALTVHLQDVERTLRMVERWEIGKRKRW